jgi:hypothetical protein
MNPKKILSVLAIAIFLTSTIAPLVVMPVSAAHGIHEPDWYMLVNGVLTTDTYDFYPWAEQSIDFGFSKFGELIYWNDVEEWGVGIQYPGYDVVMDYVQDVGDPHVDPFASEIITEHLWLNGWYMDLRYTHRSHRDRQLRAMAMFADMTVDGNDWINGWPIEIPFTGAAGGRKTTGYAESEPIKVLYDGPRRFIAVTTTHVYDWIDQPALPGGVEGEVDHPDETWPLVDVTLTFVFNKVKKQVIIYKDIKQIIEGKELDSPIDIQFSNREEWDLGSNPTYRSWAHFYHQNFTTCYGPEWHMAPGIMREYIHSEEVERITDIPWINNQFGVFLPDPDGPGPYDFPVVSGSTRVYLVDEITDELIFLEEGVTKDWHFAHEGSVVPDQDAIINLHPRPEPLGPGLIETYDEVIIVYKLWKYHERTPGGPIGDALSPEGNASDGIPHLYDLVQVVSEDMKWVGWKAFWPTLSDYTPDGWSQWWNPLIWVGESDLDSEKQISPTPDIAFTIGEWDFQLGDPDFPRQFRGVEVVGITDRHDGDDGDRPGGTQVLDRELLYQVEEIFNPWDLKKAVHKETKTWVEWTDDSTWVSNHRPFAYWDDNEWGLYNDAMGNKVFSERVYDLTNDVLLNRFEGDYALSVTTDGYGYITGLTSGIDYKIMYHTLPQTVGIVEWGLNETLIGPLSADGNVTTMIPSALTLAPDWEDVLGAMHGFNVSLGPVEISINGQYPRSDWTVPFQVTSDVEEYDFKVYKEDRDSEFPGVHTTILEDDEDIFPPHTIPLEPFLNITIDVDPVGYYVTASNDLDVTWPMVAETLHVLALTHAIDVNGYVSYNDTSGNVTMFIEMVVNVMYDEMLGGRWEHTVVGKDAASVDSAGAALITAAYKNKQREIGIAALDIQEGEPANDIPWVMRKFGGMVDSTVDEYYHDPPEDMRVSLSDDWCHTWPVSGSNLISVGGPIANVLTYYVNDFTDAFWGHPEFTPIDSPWFAEIAAIACWNKNSYANDDTTGYAVIGTYHDINGSTILTVWGLWGRDTYYASRFFHEELCEEFQRFPKCATSVILEINYTDPKHPTFDIVEVVGTISEHSEWTEIWAAREWLAANEPDYLNTYPVTGGECDWIIKKGGLHDP